MKHLLAATALGLASLATSAHAMDDIVIAFAGKEDLKIDAEYVFIDAFVESMAQHGVNAVVHPSNSMGKESDRFDQVSQGLIHVNMTNVGMLFRSTKFAAALFLPFLNKDQEEFDQLVTEINALEIMNKDTTNLGVRIAGFPMRGGTLGLFNTEKPISKMSDMDGARFRAQSKFDLPFFEAWGAKPTIVSWAETPNALQTGVAVGYMNPPSTVVSASHVELVSHFTPLEAGPVPKVVMLSDDWYSSLTDEEQGWVDQAVADGIAANRAWANERAAYFLQVLEDGGVQRTDLEAGERDKFLEASKIVWAKMLPPETLDMLLDVKE